MGRLWQIVILTEWRSVFAWLPIETLIKENQKSYYKALRISDKNSESTAFIEFMLSVILKTIKDTQDELSEAVGIARLNIIKNMKKLQEQNLIKRIGADKNGYWQVEEETDTI